MFFIVFSLDQMNQTVGMITSLPLLLETTMCFHVLYFSLEEAIVAALEEQMPHLLGFSDQSMDLG